MALSKRAEEIKGKDIVIASLQKEVRDLERQSAAWWSYVQLLYKAGDRLAMASKNRKHRLAWWDAKSREGSARR